VVIVIDGDYLDRKSRMEYLRQKMAAEGRMSAFDELDAELRVVATGAPSIGLAAEMLRRGVRTFEQAERVMAGIW
jgi:hypothetical protein